MGIVGDDPAFRKALREAFIYSQYDDFHVLLLGETGSGKEHFAQFIHHLGPRAGRPMVTVNCSSIPENLVESQLFGHKKGAFTGAASDHEGKFKSADRGVLFLDEIGELPLPAQAKLLRALDQGEIEPVGSTKPVKVNVRVIAATHRNLREMVQAGTFREDLYQRFGSSIAIPPLRSRKVDNHKPPYLSPFTVVKHTTKFLRQGIKYKDLTPEQREQLAEQTADSETVDYDKEQVSKAVFNKDTDRAILRNLMEKGICNADGTRLGKTITFARNHRHAKLLVELFDEMYPQYGGDFCLRIDNYEPRAEQLIDDFKTADGSKNLTIAVSVDMLDTGIDVPQIVNLVFAKPVKSYAKFWQMIGRGTRLCENLFGPGKHKTTFQIFDHWGNFEYFDELKKEVAPTRAKSLPEQLFETRIALAEAALAVQDLDAFQLSISLIAADISALPSECLSIREKWKDIQSMKKDGVLDAFSAATRATLKTVIAPLMVWRDVYSKEAALKFDLLTTRLSIATLAKSSDAVDLRDQVIDHVSRLPINLQPVQEKLPAIQKAKQKSTYEGATTSELDSLRTELRGIMRYQVNPTGDPPEPRYIDVKEDPGEYKFTPHHVKLAGLDLAAYRSRVESILRDLFDQSAALQNIRAGLPVAEAELDQLVQDVLLQDPDLHLDELLNHYPNKSKNLALAIRRVIGLDAEKVNDQFKDFVQQYPALNSNQIRFLELLKSHIATYGAIEIDRLWESPFTTLHAEGIDGIFPDSAQVDSLLDLLQELNLTAA